jgi:hypothetical protein
MNLHKDHVICTLFDHRYLPRGLCMIQSARRHGFTQKIWVLCLSAECEQMLTRLALPDVQTITLDMLEEHIPRLREARGNRSIVEYYFTCMAALHTYLFDKLPQLDGTMYVDADIKFFANPEIVFDAIADAPVAITPHNFVPAMRSLERSGVFNGGWSAFRRTPEGQLCLKWWLERSLEWCYDRVDEDRYANQAYMNRFPEIAPAAKILRGKGFNCAPWNIGNYKVTERDGRIWVDNEPLVFFHFHGLRRHFGFFQMQHRGYGAPVSWLMRNRLYRPYIVELLEMERLRSSIAPSAVSAKSANDLRGADRKLGILLRKIVAHPGSAAAKLIHLIQDLPVLIIGTRAL